MDLSSKKTPSIVVEEFLTFCPNTSPMTIDSPKHEEDHKHSQNIIIRGEKLEVEKKKVDYQNQNEQNNFSEKRRNSSGAFTNIFRNFITCGAVETNDSSIITMNRTHIPSFTASNDKSMEICETENFVASQQRLLSTHWDIQPTNNGRKSCNGANGSSKEKTEFGSNKSFSAAKHKPLKDPNCSQCGKPFKPEKLHSHMKSCKGMKALARGRIPITSATAADADKTSKDPLLVDSLSGYHLTH